MSEWGLLLVLVVGSFLVGYGLDYLSARKRELKELRADLEEVKSDLEKLK